MLLTRHYRKWASIFIFVKHIWITTSCLLPCVLRAHQLPTTALENHRTISHTGAKPGKPSKEDRNAGSDWQQRFHRPWPLPLVVVAIVRWALYASVNRDHCPFTALCNEWYVLIYGSIKRSEGRRRRREPSDEENCLSWNQLGLTGHGGLANAAHTGQSSAT